MSRLANAGKGRIFYVYALLDSRKPGKHRYGRWVFDYEPFYVGKGHNGRVLNHLSMSERSTIMKGSTFRAKLSRKILKEGFEIGYRLIKTELSEEEAFLKESELILRIGRRSCALGPLTNLSNGGEGDCGICRTEPSLRRKYSEAALAQNARMTDAERKIKSKKLSEAHSARSAKEEKLRIFKRLATLATRSEEEKAKTSKKKSDSLRAFYADAEKRRSAALKREATNLERYGKATVGPRDFMTAKAIKALNESLRGQRKPMSKEVLEARNEKILAYRAGMTEKQREERKEKCRNTRAASDRNKAKHRRVYA